jgi:hypothetical protein
VLVAQRPEGPQYHGRRLPRSTHNRLKHLRSDCLMTKML